MPTETCPECFHDVDIEGRYCPVCGYDVNPENDDATPETTDEPSSPGRTPAQSPVGTESGPNSAMWLSKLEEAADWNAIFLFLLFAFLLLTFFA